MYSKIGIFPLVGSFSPIIPLAKNDLPAPVFPSNIILGTFSDPEGDPIIFEDLDSEHLPCIGRFGLHWLYSEIHYLLKNHHEDLSFSIRKLFNFSVLKFELICYD